MIDRSDWVDYAKGIGIILVVYGHVARGLFNAGMDMPEKLYRLADSIIYSFHMPLFFFLSGLFFCKSVLNRGRLGFALSKIDTIVYPYLVWSILQGVVEAAMSNYTSGSATFSEVFALWVPRAQFWFLYALFFISIFSIALYTFVSDKWFFAILILMAALYLLRPEFLRVSPVIYIINNFIYFALGVVFTKYDLGNRLSTLSSFAALAALFVLAQYLFHGYAGKVYTQRGMESLLLASISIFFIIALSKTLSKYRYSGFLAHVGVCSMAIYLIHILAGSGTRVVLTKLVGVDVVSIHLLAGCVVGILVPLLVVKFTQAFNVRYVFSAPLSRSLHLREYTK